MKPVAFDYVRPARLEEACELLADEEGFVKVLAGGQSLGPMLNLRLVQPDRLVDVARIRELGRIEERGGAVVIGACVTSAAVEDGAVPGRLGERLARVAGEVAYRAVRNRGTLGGSVAHADPAADWPSCLAALGAEALVRGPSGTRTVALEEFVIAPFEVALEPGELLEALVVPALSARARFGYYKFCRKAGEFAEAIGAVLDDPERGRLRAVIGATEARAIVLEDASGLLAGGAERPLAERLEMDAVRELLAGAGLAPDSYEGRVHAVALERAFGRLA